MPEADNNIVIIGDNPTSNVETTGGSVIPPLPPVEASSSNPISDFDGNIVLYIILVVLIVILVIMLRSRKTKEKKISEIIEQEPEEKQEESESSIQAQKAVTKQDYININEPKTNQTKFTFSTPKNLDTCIKKFLEITKNK